QPALHLQGTKHYFSKRTLQITAQLLVVKTVPMAQ
ncbi:polymorphic outer membrane protein, partial [Chlamydia psittaci 08-2626_L3]